MQKEAPILLGLLIILCIVMAIGYAAVPRCESNDYIILQNKASGGTMFLEHKDETLYYSGEEINAESAEDLLTKLVDAGWSLDNNKYKFLECSENMNKAPGKIDAITLHTILLLEFQD